MDTQLLNKAMKAEARNLGLCDQWFSEWDSDTSRDELLDKYIRGIDFCIKHHYPSNEVLKEYGGDIIHDHGIYVDEEIDDEANNKFKVVANGTCTGIVRYNGFAVGDVYVCGESDVTIIVSEFAKVFVEVHDDAHAYVINKGSGRCFVYKHGGYVDKDGDVLVRNKK